MGNITLYTLLTLLIFSCNTPSVPMGEANVLDKAENKATSNPEPKTIKGTVMNVGQPSCGCDSFMTLRIQDEKIMACLDEVKDGCFVGTSAGGDQYFLPSSGDKVTFEGHYENYTCEDGVNQSIFTVKKCAIDQVMF